MWQEIDHKLCKTFTFQDFSSAIAWMNKAAAIAEQMDHHPEWTNIYNIIHVKLYTHTSGDIITEKDYLLAKQMDAL